MGRRRVRPPLKMPPELGEWLERKSPLLEVPPRRRPPRASDDTQPALFAVPLTPRPDYHEDYRYETAIARQHRECMAAYIAEQANDSGIARPDRRTQ
jgi:hypothetical protein